MNKTIRKLPLSVAIITKNEEGNLPDCLESVAFADDIVVVDSGSTDRTVEIARNYGCRVFVESWKGNGLQYNSALEKCKYKWCLVIDADERIPPETREAILSVLVNPSHDAYSFPRRNYFHGKWVKHSDWWPDRVIRLMRKDTGRYLPGTHGKWTTNSKLNNSINCPIHHYSFSNYSDMLITLNNYTNAISKELLKKERRTKALVPIYHGLSMFLKIYILKRGFLDGFDGLVIAITKAGGSFFKYAKLLELQDKNKT